LPFLLVFYQELFWGERGLLRIDRIADAAPLQAFGAFLKYQLKHYTFLNLLYLPALSVIGGNRQLLWATLAFALPNAYVIANLPGEDNVFILALDLFFVLWIMLGWQYLRERQGEWIPVVLLIVQVALLMFPERQLFRVANTDYPDIYRELGRTLLQHQRPLLVTDWQHRVALGYYNRDRPSFPLETGRWFDWSVNVTDLAALSPEQLAGVDAIYVIDDWRPSSRATVFRSEAQIEQTREQMSSRRTVEKYLDLTCHSVPGHSIALYRCR
jgi:hypothetical protein